MQRNSGTEAVRLIKLQVIVLITGSVLLFTLGSGVGFSGFLGALIALVTTVVVYRMVYRQYTAQHPEKIVGRFYVATLMRLIIAIAGFALVVLNVESLNPVALLSMYFLTQVLPAIFLNYR